MIEVLRLTAGKLLISVGVHCVECETDDVALDAAVSLLANQSKVSRQRIAAHVVRATMGADA